MTQEEKHDWFERHRKGELTEAEAAHFTQLLADDAGLLAEFRFFSALAVSLAKPARSTLRGELEAANDRFREAETRRRAFWRRMGFAALACVSLGLLWFLAQKPKPHLVPAPPQAPRETAPAPALETPKPKAPVAALPSVKQKTGSEKPRPRAVGTEFAQSFYANSQPQTLLRAVRITENAPVASATAHLANGRPNEALDALRAADDDDEEAVFLRGHAHFQLKNYAAAAVDFGQLAAGGGFRQSAQWFQLLSLAAQGPGQRAAARQLADKIASEAGHPYSELAQQVLAEFEKGFGDGKK